jgi:hypothetical protein
MRISLPGASAVRSGLLMVAGVQAAVAQCSMCRTAASAQGAQAAVLNTAILILFFPAVILFGVIVIVTLRCARETPAATIKTDSAGDVEST